MVTYERWNNQYVVLGYWTVLHQGSSVSRSRGQRQCRHLPKDTQHSVSLSLAVSLLVASYLHLGLCVYLHFAIFVYLILSVFLPFCNSHFPFVCSWNVLIFQSLSSDEDWFFLPLSYISMTGFFVAALYKKLVHGIYDLICLDSITRCPLCW